MKSMLIALVTCAALVSPRVARAQSERAGRRFGLTPFVGLTLENELVDGPVRFSDGSVDFISIDPEMALLLGVELSYHFHERLSGFLQLSYALGEASYVENDNLRPDVDMATFRIQPGILFDAVSFGSGTLGVGGGLTVAFISVDDLFWSGQRTEMSSTGVGIFGRLALEIGLSDRLRFHAHLDLELSRASVGDIEDELARADDEFSADVDADTRTAVLVGLGIKILL